MTAAADILANLLLLRTVLAAERRRQGLSQDALAAKIGRHPITLSRWETGERNPGLTDLVIWAHALGRRLDAV